MVLNICIAIAIFYGPYVGLTMVRPSLIDKTIGEKRKWLYFAQFMSYELILANSFANAVIFLSLDKKSRNKLIQKATSTLRSVRDNVRMRSIIKIKVYDINNVAPSSSSF